MTASNPFALLDGNHRVNAASPNYADEYVAIQTSIELNDNGTVTLTYKDVPVLDLEQLLVEQGQVESVTEVLSAVANLMSNSIMARVKALGADEETIKAFENVINAVADFA